MCGMFGRFGSAIDDGPAARAAARPVADALRTRGPDGSGVAAGPGWTLGHTRLAILDLSAAADQPMTDGRGGWLVFNGEIYNFRELRAELEGLGHSFRSTGDTEVVLKALRQWGVEAFPRLRGMFALAWLDTESGEALLGRDRYGVKPLAYEVRGDEFRFASDLFAMRAMPDPSLEVDPEAAYLYLGLGYVPAPYSILRNVRKLLPGTFLRVRYRGGPLRVTEGRYWSISAVASASRPGAEASSGLLSEYTRRAAEAVALRLISDVPVGVLLSGGIDSTLVAALCREQPGAEVPSFTMGFEDPAYDEAPHAARIARHLGGNHREFRIGESDALGEWSGLWAVYDEPFADASAVPMVALCRRIGMHVKVALSGDGGDEAFGGYPWHRALDRAERQHGLVRRGAGVAARVPGLFSWDRRYRARVVAESDRVGRWAALRTGLSASDARRLPVEGAADRPAFRDYFAEWSSPLREVEDTIDWACRMDLLTYLPDDLMVKTDRAGMSVGLELREPLLDHDLTDWVLRQAVADRYDRAGRRSKLLPRAALAARVPLAYIDRPKQGFTPPIGRWAAGPLRDVALSATHRLATGELAPLAADSLSALPADPRGQFLWRIMCFAGWLDHHRSITRGAECRPRVVA